jgi:sugar/nucleoside kinase (ribokinase family)
MSTLDFLAIGDIATDAFIRLSQATVTTDAKTGTQQLSVPFGDKIPFEFAEVIAGVGNSANASVAAARLGLSSALLAFVGSDQNGKDCMQVLKENGVKTDYVQVEQGKLSNYHYVLWYDADRTILVKHQHYTYTLPKHLPAPRWIYLSSLGANTEQYHHEIESFLNISNEFAL